MPLPKPTKSAATSRKFLLLPLFPLPHPLHPQYGRFWKLPGRTTRATVPEVLTTFVIVSKSPASEVLVLLFLRLQLFLLLLLLLNGPAGLPISRRSPRADVPGQVALTCPALRTFFHGEKCEKTE